MKLKEGFFMQTIAGQTAGVTTGAAATIFNGIVRPNSTAEFILDILRQDTTVDAIAQALCSAYDVSMPQALADVKAFVDTLRQKGLIDE